MSRRGRRVAMWAGVVGIVALFVGGYAARDWILEEWWVRQLNQEDPRARYAALDSLIERGSLRAVPYLLQEAQAHRPASDDEIVFVPSGVSQALVEICWRDRANALPTLRPVLGSPDPLLRRTAVGCIYAATSSLRRGRLAGWEGRDASRTLREIRHWVDEVGTSVVVPLLVDMLSDPDPWTREVAMWALSELGPFAWPQLRQLLTHPDPWVRSRAAFTLAEQIPTKEDTANALLKQLGDTDDEVRLAAAANLGALETQLPRVADALAATLLNEREHEDVKIAAASSLFEIVQRAHAFHRASRTPGAPVSHAPYGLVAAAAVSTFAQALKADSRWVRLVSARWLGWLGAEATAAITALYTTTHDPDPDVREAVARALEKIQVGKD